MRTGRLREAEGPLRPHIQEGQMTEQLFARSLEVPAAGTQQAVTRSHFQKRCTEATAPGVLPAWGACSHPGAELATEPRAWALGISAELGQGSQDLLLRELWAWLLCWLGDPGLQV